jgi:hypothetical protein
MSIDRNRYPSNWNEISFHIRFVRAGNRCEWCGVQNGIEIVRKPGTPHYLIDTGDGYLLPDGTPIRMSELPDGFDYDHTTRVVLTTAHLGTDYPDGRKGDKHDKMDVRDENLAALCQRCHLLYDIDEHTANRKQTLARKKHNARIAAGQRSMSLKFEE